MSRLWTPEMDAQLQATRREIQLEVGGTPTSPEDIVMLASIYVSPAAIAKRLGTTEDRVRNRLKRLDQMARESAAQPADDDEAFVDIAVPEGEFVGLRIAFWDIETTDLKAMMGRILCWAIADNWGHITHATIYDFPQDSIIDDRGVSVALRNELEKYDINVGWNNKMFDGPMLNARLMRWGERPLRSDLMVIDPMWRARPGAYGIRIGSSRLVNVDEFFNRGRADGIHKSETAWDTWALAQAGDKEAMAYLVDHCDRDVLVTRDVFNHLKPLIKNIHR